jgi:hypothetical protein
MGRALTAEPAGSPSALRSAARGHVRPRLPRPLAHRIDRLARVAHRFHRFAHHPLCSAYRAEVIPLGRKTRVCRGCAYAGAGLLAGAVAGAVLRPPAALGALAVALAVALLGAAFLLRPPKLVTRLLPALLVGFAATAGPIGVTAAAAAVVAVLYFAYRRRGPHRAPCATCPERASAPTCSGFLPILRREQAFRRLSGRWLRDAGW